MNKIQISLLAAFDAAKIEYVVVGGMAVNAHGYVRATHDLDLLSDLGRNALASFGALLANPYTALGLAGAPAGFVAALIQCFGDISEVASWD